MDDGEHYGDLVGHVPQPSRPAPPRKEPLTAADVRRIMVELIDTARAADALPLDDAFWSKKIVMFPIMAQWLDPEDGAQLMFEFNLEIERLKLAA